MATQEEVLNVLRNTSTSIFLTGEAGTGKSWVINHWLEEAREKQNILVSAPTGVAAINIGGETLHRIFSIPFQLIDPVGQANFNRHKFGASRKKVLQRAEVLLIDEISMVRSDILTYIDCILKTIRMSELPFGGIRLVAVGDPFQLPPVVTSRENVPNPWFFQSPAWTEIVTYNLTENKRQAGDADFANLLTRCRRGIPETSDLLDLGMRVKNEVSDKTITLSPVNRTVDAINAIALAKLPGDEECFSAEITINTPMLDENKVEKQMLAKRELVLKVGARVMLLNNDSTGYWVNGSMGIIEEFQNDRIKVLLDTGASVFVPKNTWCITETTASDAGFRQKVLAEFTQYPIALGWAVTVHKAQGLSLPNVHFHFDYVFAKGQAYVALSRCTSMEGLSLSKPLRRDNIKADHDVLKFMMGY